MGNVQIIIEFHGVIFSVFSMCFLLLKHAKQKKVRNVLLQILLVNICMLVADMFAIHYAGQPGRLGQVIVPLSNFCVFFFQILLVTSMAIYIRCLVESHDPDYRSDWLKIVYVIAAIDISGLLLTPFTGLYYYIDSQNFYHRGRFFGLCIFLAVCIMILEGVEVYRNREKIKIEEMLALVSYFICPVLGLIIQVLFYGFSFLNIGITFSVLLLILEHEILDARLQRRQEIILAQSRAYLLNSQIKPHFIFNSLSVIQSLIEEDPETAQEAISHFSRYLRKNLDLKVSESAISIREEMDFTRNYLYMEKLRFGEKLQIVYDIDDRLDFDVPFLSIQPFAENAVRHGIRKKLEGGTLTIRVYAEESDYCICVIDDGAGFDPEHLPDRSWDSEHNGVGVKNVQERVRLLCNGRVITQSAPGQGTRITIRIPKNRLKIW